MGSVSLLEYILLVGLFCRNYLAILESSIQLQHESYNFFERHNLTRDLLHFFLTPFLFLNGLSFNDDHFSRNHKGFSAKNFLAKNACFYVR